MESFEEQKTVEILGETFVLDNDGFVELGEVSRKLLGMQGQYGARYADDLDSDYPNLGEGLRIKGDAGSYHEMKVHAEDVEAFVSKVKEHKGIE